MESCKDENHKALIEIFMSISVLIAILPLFRFKTLKLTTLYNTYFVLYRQNWRRLSISTELAILLHPRKSAITVSFVEEIRRRREIQRQNRESVNRVVVEIDR